MGRHSWILAGLLILAAMVVVTSAAELKVTVEAEKLAMEEGGTCCYPKGRTEVSGGVQVSCWDFPGHALYYDVTIPETANYKLVLRWCSKEDVGIDLLRDVRIDGAYPHEALKKIVFYRTGGWANGANDWINLTVCDAKGAPVLVKLTAGVHKVRMENLNGRISFDCFGFLGADVDPGVLGKQTLVWQDVIKAAKDALLQATPSPNPK